MVRINVCIGSSCHTSGAQNVVSSFQHLVEDYRLHDKVAITASYCMRRCGQDGVGVSLTIDDEPYRVAAENARNFFREHVLPKAQ